VIGRPPASFTSNNRLIKAAPVVLIGNIRQSFEHINQMQSVPLIGHYPLIKYPSPLYFQ